MPETVEREPKLLIPRLESFYDVAIPLADTKTTASAQK